MAFARNGGFGTIQRSQGNPRGFPRETRVPLLMFAYGRFLRALWLLDR